MKTILISIISIVLLYSNAFGNIVINSDHHGYYTHEGAHDQYNFSTIVGYRTHYCNSYYQFTIPEELPSITEVQLRIQVDRFYDYGLPTTSLNLDVYDVETHHPYVVGYHPSSPDGINIYNDLQSGIKYGTTTLEQSDVGNVLEIYLSSDAISEIIASKGNTFMVGLHLDTAEVYGYALTIGTGIDYVKELVLVPEPSTICLFALGGLLLKRKKQTTQTVVKTRDN